MKNSKNLNEETKKRIRKAARISLCAVLAGGLSLGGLQAATRLDNFQVASVQAAEAEVSLLKNEESGETTERVKGALDVSDIVEEAMPSVVSISTKSVQEVQDYFSMFGFYGYAPRSQQYEVEGGGSGIIVGRNDSEVLIATNYHVIEDANEIAVCFIDNNAYTGVVKGYDADKDIAIVAVSLEDISKDTLDQISIAKIGSSDDLRVGEQILIVGNAMGYGQSVTTGIVSAKNRQSLNKGGYGSISDEDGDGINLIQTDAAINPGNSGGAMLNMNGEVVGISNQKSAGTLIEGMCYAIAISDVEDAMTEIMNQKTRTKQEGTHGAFGISATTVSSEASQVYGIPSGAFVVEVNEDSAADRAGIKPNTVITKLDGKSVSGVQELIGLLEYYEVGEEVEVTVAEQNGSSYEEKTYTVILEESKSENTEDEKEEKEAESDNLYRDWADAWTEDGFNIPDDDDDFWKDDRDRRSDDWDDEKDDDDDEDDGFVFGQGTFGDWD